MFATGSISLLIDGLDSLTASFPLSGWIFSEQVFFGEQRGWAKRLIRSISHPYVFVSGVPDNDGVLTNLRRVCFGYKNGFDTSSKADPTGI